MTPEQQALWDEALGRRGVATAGLIPYFRDLVSTMHAALGREVQVVEFGVRTGTSTIGWLAGGARLFSVDMYVDAKHKPTYDRIRAAWPRQWTFQLASTLDVDIPECDVLFVDDLHNYEHVRRELELHAPLVRSAIVFHDTTTLGTYGQPQYDPKTKRTVDGKKNAGLPDQGTPGVRLAVDSLLIGGGWQTARSEWGHNGCLTVVRSGAAFPKHLLGVYV